MGPCYVGHAGSTWFTKWERDNFPCDQCPYIAWHGLDDSKIRTLDDADELPNLTKEEETLTLL